MAMTDAVKRKEPEPDSSEAPKADVQPAAAAAPAADAAKAPAAAAQPATDAKRLRPTPPDPAAVRKQVEYYLSDENLRYDKFFSEKIAADPEGWLDMNMILSCNKMKSMRATKEDVAVALKGSKIEVRPDGAAVRRPGNTPLPSLEAKPQHQKKSSIHAHDGGVVAVFKNIPEEQSWTQVKQKLQEKLPPKVALWFVSEVSDSNSCTIAAAPFDGDMQFFEELELDMGGAKLKAEVCHGDLLHQSLKLLPKHVRDKRERESRKRQKERSRPIAVGTQRFINVAALRGRVKEILNSRSDGEQLKPDGSDFKLIKALLEYHPKGAEKSQGLIGLKVGKSEQGDNRCFYMLKEGGVEEDFSAKKCLDAVELNPPYVKAESKEKEKPAPKAAAAPAVASSPAAAPMAAAPAAEGEAPAQAAAAAEPTAAQPAAAEPSAVAAAPSVAVEAQEPSSA